MEHTKLATGNFVSSPPRIVPNLYVFWPPLIDQALKKSTFPNVFRKIKKRDGHGKVMEKYFVKSVGTLIINE